MKYEDTNDYHWPLISNEHTTSYVNRLGKTPAVPEIRGPFGFGDAITLNSNKVSYSYTNSVRKQQFLRF